MMFFISYSHKDKTITDAICNHLENNKIRCWMAPRDIVPGDNWAESIAHAIPNAKVFLLVFSSESNMSKQVLREVELGVSNGLIVIPARIDDIKPTGGMAYYLSTVHWVDIVDKSLESKLTMLSNTVSNVLEAGETIRNNTFTARFPETKKVKKHRWILPLIASIIVLAIASGLFVFRDSIFNNGKDNQSTLVNETTSLSIEETVSPEPTFAPTAVPSTPSPEPTATATVDPNISIDAIVDIPDAVLKSYILRALEEQGHKVTGNITVSDMRNLEELAIVSSVENRGFAWYYTSLADNVMVSDIGIDTLEGLQYASNLKRLVVVDQDLKISLHSPKYIVWILFVSEVIILIALIPCHLRLV